VLTRLDRVEVLWLLDGPVNGERFLRYAEGVPYVEGLLRPTQKPREIVIMDNLGSP
jgi:hypothetical protein